MSDNIKQEPSASTENESREMMRREKIQELVRNINKELSTTKVKEEPEMVTISKVELNQLKRKLEQSEAGWQKDKKKLRKLGRLEALVATGVELRPVRARISLVLPNGSKLLAAKKHFEVYSEPAKVAGFEWKLKATKDASKFWLYLCATPPKAYTGDFKLYADFSIRLLNTISSKDIKKELVKQSFVNSELGDGWGFAFLEIKKLQDLTAGFLWADGSIKIEADFTVLSSTLDHFLADDDDEETTEDGSGENEEN